MQDCSKILVVAWIFRLERDVACVECFVQVKNVDFEKEGNKINDLDIEKTEVNKMD